MTASVLKQDPDSWKVKKRKKERYLLGQNTICLDLITELLKRWRQGMYIFLCTLEKKTEKKKKKKKRITE